MNRARRLLASVSEIDEELQQIGGSYPTIVIEIKGAAFVWAVRCKSAGAIVPVGQFVVILGRNIGATWDFCVITYSVRIFIG